MGVKAAVGREVGITSVFSFPLDRAVRGAGLSMLARGPVGFLGLRPQKAQDPIPCRNLIKKPWAYNPK